MWTAQPLTHPCDPRRTWCKVFREDVDPHLGEGVPAPASASANLAEGILVEASAYLSAYGVCGATSARKRLQRG
eukprot:CAMPEP_0119367704 /NCGR_PEP_ID=MMETSP1334-20130426/14459_1 /TAXON_ID=127549 /ORGANISM="Calcidiscus leptoporus, Strain RCC1130" /LENGTH=73 /DNA_ID=CAMNT_0007384171 /DNA_START=459 /DNA_END=680 /DNA_ORIENTATION=-